MKLTTVEAELNELYKDILNIHFRAQQVADKVPQEYRSSVTNLIHYLTMRRREMRKVHDLLSDYGISGLRSAESYVFRNLTDVLKLIKLVLGKEWVPHGEVAALGYKQSKRLLHQRSSELLGQVAKPFKTQVMLDVNVKMLGGLTETVAMEAIPVVHFDLARCGYSNSLEAIQRMRTQLPAKRQPHVIVSLQGRRVLLDTRSLVDHEGAPYKRRLTMRRGDHLTIDNTAPVGMVPVYGDQQQLITAAVVPTLLMDTPLRLQPGDQVILGKGKVIGRVLDCDDHSVEIVITHCENGKYRLARYAEVWLPASQDYILSPADKRNMKQIIQHADTICVDGLDNQDKILRLQEEMEAIGCSQWNKMLLIKVDSSVVIKHLAVTIIAAMQQHKVGLWLDNDRLLSDLGAERLSEMQDQVSWIAEASHIPLIWGGHLLQSQTEIQSIARSEVTETVQAIKAEAVCIKQDKGLGVKLAALRDIMQRVEKHYSKKKSTMRALQLATASMLELEHSFYDRPDKA